MNQKQYLTQEGYDKLVQELDYVKNVEQKKNIEDLQDARSQGDLSENADYDAARDQQAKIAARIKELELIIKNAVIISEDSGNNLGKTIKIRFLDNVEDDEEEVETYQIVGSLQADPLNGLISNESPLGKAVLDKKVGDKVYVKTESLKEFWVEILDIK
jgi:transcription elongation factor GreA